MSTATVSPPLPERINIPIARGVAQTITFLLTDAAGRPIDLSEAEVTLSARAEWTGEVKLAAQTNAPGEHVDAAGGKTAFVITADVSQGDELEVWLYEVRSQTGQASRIHIIGELRLLPEHAHVR